MSDLIDGQTAAAFQYVEADDRESVLQLARTHAESVCERVWPGGTVRVGDNVEIGWNDRLRSCAGKCKYERRDGYPREKYARVDLAWGYYERHGVLELLQVVRHELIHAWQYLHPDGDPGHGPTFRQWVDDMDCERYCKHW